jgi:aminopeptidase N
MKKFLKWVLMIFSSILILLLFALVSIFILHDRYWFYPSGGQLSELQQSYDVKFYDLNLEPNYDEQSISGFVNIKLKSLIKELPTIELELVDNFDISKVTINDEPLQFTHNDDIILISLKNNLKLNEEIEISIHYSGQPIEAIMPPWIGGFNWSEDKNGNHWIGVSCQGEGGKIWFPCKSHPSDEPDSVAINITAEDPYICASNGVLEKTSKPKEGYTTYHWFTRYPTNNYNISINIAKYKTIENSYTTINGNEVPVVFYYLREPEKMADSLVYMAIDMLKTFEIYFGEYPFVNEKFGLAETSYLGMEHQTINSYGNRYFFRKREELKVDFLMLHEMAHEWWGNKVSVRDWADFWIHEGIGTYSEALYLRHKLGEEGYHNHIANIKRKITNESPILKRKNTNSSSSYSGDIYNKGAYFMHSLRYMIGDSLFFPILYQFANDTNYTYYNFATTEDFLSLVNKNTDDDYSAFFKMYLETNDLPNVVIDSIGDNRWSISLENTEVILPMDILTDEKLIKVIVSENPIEIISNSRIVVDPKNWYLHKKDFLKID